VCTTSFHNSTALCVAECCLGTMSWGKQVCAVCLARSAGRRLHSAKHYAHAICSQGCCTSSIRCALVRNKVDFSIHNAGKCFAHTAMSWLQQTSLDPKGQEFWVQNTEEEAHEQMSYAWDQGINFMDTAEMYPVPPAADIQGRTEQYIGTWMKNRKREDVVLASKVRCPPWQQRMRMFSCCCIVGGATSCRYPANACKAGPCRGAWASQTVLAMLSLWALQDVFAMLNTCICKTTTAHTSAPAAVVDG
jgi:Aldo/keto reductase family